MHQWTMIQAHVKITTYGTQNIHSAKKYRILCTTRFPCQMMLESFERNYLIRDSHMDHRNNI
jgi:hypothetical protein